MAELSLDDSRKEEQLAEGLLAILSPAVQQVDGKIGDVRVLSTVVKKCHLLPPLVGKYKQRVSFSLVARKSQAELKDKIDYLAEELRVLSERQKVPVDLDMYIKKLANSRRRILLVNDILQNVQDRLEKLHRNVTKETARQKVLIEASP